MGQRGNSERLSEILAVVHAIGKASIAPHAGAVDRDARFPTEAYAGLKSAKLLTCYVPSEHGGMGLNVLEVGKICEVLALYCGSTAMIFAMHQIQVACIVHHALQSPYFRAYVAEMVEHQYLLASATTELGIGGDVRSSKCAVLVEGDRFTLEKQAPVISYGESADGILVTARKSATAGPNEQVHVLVKRGSTALTRLSEWDTLGFRGTCSSGFALRAEGDAAQILPTPYADIHAKTMHPFSHSVWSSLWLGIATDSVQKARQVVRAEARKTPGVLPPNAMRLAEVDSVLFTMRGAVHNTLGEYQDLLDAGDDAAFSSNFGFSIRINNLKVRSSQLIVEIVSGALLIAGIAGYRNDSPASLCRQLRDAYGAALMVNNDRILGQSCAMQIVVRES